MRVMATTARLLAASAICCAFSARALAQDYGLQSTDGTPISNPSGSTLEGAKTGVYSTGDELNLDNAGTIRGNGSNGSVFNSDGGVIISGGPAYITNSGDISGARFGISTIYYDLGGGSFEGRAIGSNITNSGSIIGESDDGIRLIGGGTVTNSGYIAGQVGAGADGISIFAYNGQDTSGITSLGSVTNLAGGVIEGNRWGVVIFGPGSIDNAGTINHGATIQGSFLISGPQSGTIQNSGSIDYIDLASLSSATIENSGHVGRIDMFGDNSASLTNSGTIDYFASINTVGTADVNNSGSIGEGLIFNHVTTASVVNSGSITTTGTPDVVGTTQDAVFSDAALTLTNTATGSINGFVSGIRSNGASLTLDNAGTIRGNGNQAFSGNSAGGVVLQGGPGYITNSGSISGQQFGITTIYVTTDPFLGLAIGSTVNNSGSIIGDNNDGIRLIGGGTVTNSGYIAGRVGAVADGVSMFSFEGQDLASFDVIGSVTNLAGGIIEGNRFGVIMSNGGIVDNAGTISGNSGSVLLQAQAVGPELPRTGSVTNSGTLNGTVQFNNLASASVTNSGTIQSPNGNGVYTTAPGGPLSVNNQGTGSITGSVSGIRTDGTSLTLDNAGTIRGNGNEAFSANSAGGVVLQGGPGYITNSGLISGQQFGITTIYVTTDPFLGLAIGSTVDNSGSIIGDNNDGVRLIGGGTVVNSGYIAGRVGPVADGVSMFAYEDQDLSSFDVIGSVTNLAGGVIEGNRFGVIMSNGGFVDNAGTITGIGGSILLQAKEVGPEPARTGTVINSGTLNGVVQFNNLTASVDNSGSISNPSGPAIYATFPSASLSVTNHATGSITGGTSGILSEASIFSLVNDGTVRGNGNSTVFSSPNAGILITGGPGSIVNSGTISGQQFGITTFDQLVDPATFTYEGRAVGTTVTNTGTIIGDNNDGIRLIGGGTVTNSGYIAGRVGAGADGISMFAYEDQDTTGLPSIGTVNNLTGGVVEGHRFGVILSGGGEVNNAGTINGGTGGAILIQTRSDDDHGRTGMITNSGAINGLVKFYNLDSASLDNSGSILATTGQAIHAAFPSGAFSVTNEEDGSIEGAKSGIFSQAATFSLLNSGTIRGNGTYDGFDDTPDAGVTISGGPATIENYGSITGQRFGITTIYNWDDANQLLQGLAIGSTVENHGTIIGDTDIGIRLNGGGTVINDGYIAGRVGPNADGVWMMAFNDQPLESFTSIGSVINLAGGVIEGARRGVTLANGGTVDNAGTISGNVSGIRIVALANDPGRTGTVTNSGTINGGVELLGLASGTLINSGTVNAAGSGFAVTSSSPTTLVNSGTIHTTGPTAISFQGTYNDTVTLQTGSAITGTVDGGGGTDTLRLSGTINSPTSQQTVGNFLNFENLNVLGGYWTAPGNTGTFSSTVVGGGTLAVNGTITSPIGVNAGAVLGGTGTITGNVTINSGGALNPGNGVGTINVTGNVTFGSGSFFRVDALSTGTADKLAVNGNVSIGSGSTLQVLGGSGTWSPKTSYTVVTANNISGKFSSVTSNLAFLSPQLATKNASIVLTLTRNGKPITSAATAETFSTASAISGLAETNPIYASILSQSVEGARQGFAALSGAGYDRLDALLADDFGHLETAFDEQASAPTLSWSGANPFQARGFHSGSAFARGPVAVMAIGGAYKRHLSADSISADVETRFLANAVGYRSGRFQAIAGLTTAWHDGTVSRIVSFPGFFEQTRARELTETQKLEGQLSYALPLGKFAAAPYAGLSSLTIRTRAFDETGGFSALSFDRAKRSLTEAVIGFRMRGRLNLGDWSVTPHLDASLHRRWGDLRSSRSAEFASGSQAFDSIGAGFDSRLVSVDAGLDLTDGPLTIAAGYQGRIGNQWKEHSALLSAALRF